MNDDDPILSCFHPPAGGDMNRYATIGDGVRDYVYEHVDPYPEVLWALVAGLFAWAFDVEHAGAHERTWPRRVNRIEAMQIAIKYIEQRVAEEQRIAEEWRPGRPH